jgi:mannose-6-phosphate isomerase-like protein (cupin superfamily)
VLHPGQRGRIHAHESQEEVYLVLEGTLSLFVEGEEATLERGELMRVAPGMKRQLVNRGPGPLHLLAIGGAGEHQGRDGLAFTDWDATDSVSPQEMAMPEDLPAAERRG